MLSTIVVTAAVTAIVICVLCYKRNSYIHGVEQLSLNRAEEIELLTAELHAQQDLATGLLASNAVYRARLRAADALTI